jgi:ABC-2 type transport system ATP-binding protein
MNTDSPQPVIEVRRLAKIFRDFWRRPKARAVDDISFDVRPGEVFGLLGPNGSGKSTTIKILLGLLHPTAGDVRVLGADPGDVKVKRRIGYLPEESTLIGCLTARETLEFYGGLFSMPAPRLREAVDRLLDLVGLRGAEHRAVNEFSKGMQRRVGLAQALINDPDLVLLDEPTSGLDPIGCRQVKDLIRDLAARGRTVLLSSHLLADVEDVCDRIAILYNGRLRAAGPIDELLEVAERTRVTLPPLEDADLERVLAGLRAALPVEPEIDHPRLDLERFFIETVRHAREESEAGGRAP